MLELTQFVRLLVHWSYTSGCDVCVHPPVILRPLSFCTARTACLMLLHAHDPGSRVLQTRGLVS